MTTTAQTPDNLALPISFEARHGAGRARALVLGGGGVAAITWQVSYLDELAKRGLDLSTAELMVGTSAGSVVCATLAAGRIGAVARELEVLTKAPTVVSALTPTTNLAPSQKLASGKFRDAVDAEPETVRDIGYAALAAASPPPEHLPRVLFAAVRTRRWGNPGLRIVTTDAYSGERLVLTEANAKVHVMRASAASASVPGIFSPQPIGDRKCVDGGVAGSATHCDVVAGAERVLVLPLAAGVPAPGMYCQRPDSLDQELEQLRGSGSRVELRVPNLPSLTPADLMSPAAIPVAIKAARAQAAAEVDGLLEFWNG